MIRFFIGFIVLMGSGCSLFGDTQPGLSGDPYSIPRFDSGTTFPYTATVERRQQILSNYLRVQNGMNGDAVLAILDRPDEVAPMRFVGEPTRGWVWDYFINKQFERAPDEYDKHIAVFFDKSGLVYKFVVKLDAGPRPTPLEANTKIKIANAVKQP